MNPIRVNMMENVRERDLRNMSVNVKVIGQAKTAETVSIWHKLTAQARTSDIRLNGNVKYGSKY